jgi:hypothetical protein
VTLAASGCGYFHPARPENPSNGEIVTIDLTSPEGTLATIKAAVEAKGLKSGDVAYRACFADSTATTTPAFHAFFDPNDAYAWNKGGHLLPTDWTLKNEGPFYNLGPQSLVALAPQSYLMTWDLVPNQPDEFATSIAVLHRHYLIVATGQDGAIADLVAKGFADLTLVQSSTGGWVIVLWNDHVDPDTDPLFQQKTMGLRRLESQ